MDRKTPTDFRKKFDFLHNNELKEKTLKHNSREINYKSELLVILHTKTYSISMTFMKLSFCMDPEKRKYLV